MKNYLFVKKISLVLVIASVMVLSSCKAEPPTVSPGEIKDVVIEDSGASAPESLFSEKNVPFNYAVKEAEDPRAGMVFNIPSDWTIASLNGRMMEIKPPIDDPHLGGAVFLLSHIYNVADYYSASSLYTLFSEIDKYAYRIDGGIYHIVDLPSPKEALDDPSYAEGKDLISIREYEDIVFMGAKSSINKGRKDMVNVFVNWPSSPTMLSAVFSPAQRESVREMAEYITSTMKSYEPYIDSTKICNIGDYSFTCLKDFNKEGSSVRGFNAMSGVNIGILRFGDRYTQYGIDGLMETIVRETVGIAGSFVPFTEVKNDKSFIGPYPAIEYEGSTSYICDYDQYYGTGGNLYYRIFAFGKSDKTLLVVVMYEQDQGENAERVIELLKATFS